MAVSASIIATHKAILCNLEERQLRDTLNNISYQKFNVFFEEQKQCFCLCYGKYCKEKRL